MPFIGLAILFIAFLLNAADPAITVKIISTNQLQITITNATGGEVYGLYHRSFLQAPYVWTLDTVGTNGQTNFVVDRSLANIGFFQIITGDDWDGDGIPNTSDAGIGNTNIGTLSITILGPAEGTTIY